MPPPLSNIEMRGEAGGAGHRSGVFSARKRRAEGRSAGRTERCVVRGIPFVIRNTRARRLYKKEGEGWRGGGEGKGGGCAR